MSISSCMQSQGRRLHSPGNLSQTVESSVQQCMLWRERCLASSHSSRVSSVHAEAPILTES